MLIAIALFALQAPTAGGAAPGPYSGRAGQVAVRPPRLAGDVVIDGVFDEPQWRQAALLNGFSERSPIDGVPAADTTEVRVWYSATALYLGVHAIDRSGAVRATLATRDQIGNDDNVQIFLSTFNDGRQATVFAVNPLGVQADGALNESGAVSCGFGNCNVVTRQAPNLAPDFVWESKGRLTPDGYDVEIRIPFKSIRFQSGKVQTWGINILRYVQRTAQEQTWTMTRLNASSFLAQSGQLIDLTGLDAGHTLDIVPTVTQSVVSSPDPGNGRWDATWGRPQVGGDLAYGITPNLTLRATAHPDFSQVESDVTQFAFDPRQAVFYPEKRPFFLDGVEQFDAPANLIYTRSIIQPVFASKLAGKIGNNQIGFLAAVDDKIGSHYGDNPVFGLLRASHDLGSGRLGVTWTEQHDGPETNRVFDLDTRILLDHNDALTITGAYAHDDDGAGTVNDAPLWGIGLRHNGRHIRFNYAASGTGEDFITRSGFISQAGVANTQFDNSYTWLWPKSALQSFTGDIQLNGVWHYHDFVDGGPILNRQLHFNFNAVFRSGWAIGTGLFIESFGYDSTIYTNYRVQQPDGTFTQFTGGHARLPNHDYVLNFNTPVWKKFDLNFFELAGLNDENYGEWSSAKLAVTSVGTNFRPSNKVRLNITVNDTRIFRPSDDSRELLQTVVVGTLEYQISRAFQLRLIPQYSINARDSLRDDSRTNLPIYIAHADGTFTRAGASDNRQLLTNFLFTYLPNPGTVVYVGYGNVATQPNRFNDPRLGVVQNDWFVKVSYLFRMRS